MENKSGNLYPEIKELQNNSENNSFQHFKIGNVIEINNYMIGEICEREKSK